MSSFLRANGQSAVGQVDRAERVFEPFAISSVAWFANRPISKSVPCIDTRVKLPKNVRNQSSGSQDADIEKRQKARRPGLRLHSWISFKFQGSGASCNVMNMQAAFTVPQRSVARPALQRGWGVFVVILGIVTLLSAAVLGVYVVEALRSMTVTLHDVSAQMAHLESMDEKLSKTNTSLSVTNMHLARMDHQAEVAGNQLVSMEQTMRGMSATTSLMRAELRSMSTDIHTMSHKISGSFLFRSVK